MRMPFLFDSRSLIGGQHERDDLEISPAPDISVTGMVVSVIPMVVIVLASIFLRLHGVWTLCIATVRCIAQLLVLGLILFEIIDHNEPYSVLPYLFVMILFATREAAVKPKYRYIGMWRDMLRAVILGLVISFAIITSFVLRPDPWWDAQIMIPICGMLLGNCVNTLSLGMDRLLLSLLGSGMGSASLQTYLACGATRWEAALPSIREAIETGLTPTLNQMSVMGLVSIPGMMTGQILGGTPPFLAAQYQIMIMFFVCSNSYIVLFTVMVQAVLQKLFDRHHRFKVHVISVRKSGKPKDLLTASVSKMVHLAIQVRGKVVRPSQEDTVGQSEAMPSEVSQARGYPGTFRRTPPHRHSTKTTNSLLSLTGGCIRQGQSSDMLLSKLDIALDPAEVVILTGPSGSGKSTTLRALAALEPMECGALRLRGEEFADVGAAKWRTEVCYVRQQGGQGLQGTPRELLSRLCSFKSQTQRLKEDSKKNRIQAFESMQSALVSHLETVNLPPEMIDRGWERMSGGESQRAYICVLLALRPAALLLDEPTSACDDQSARKVESLLLSSDLALIWISHDPAQIERLEGSGKACIMAFEKEGDEKDNGTTGSISPFASKDFETSGSRPELEL